MPKVAPFTASGKEKERWRRADDNFRGQLGALLGRTGMKMEDLARMMGVSAPTMYARRNHPATLRKSEERALIGIFARYGMKYDPLLGERDEARTA